MLGWGQRTPAAQTRGLFSWAKGLGKDKDKDYRGHMGGSHPAPQLRYGCPVSLQQQL